MYITLNRTYLLYYLFITAAINYAGTKTISEFTSYLIFTKLLTYVSVSTSLRKNVNAILINYVCYEMYQALKKSRAESKKTMRITSVRPAD